MTLRSRRQPFRRPFSAPIFSFIRDGSTRESIRFVDFGAPDVLFFFFIVAASWTAFPRRETLCCGRGASPLAGAAVDAPRTGGVDPPIGVVVVVAAAPRFFFPVAPPSPGRGVFFAATMSCVVPASTETTTRERERERERERDVRSFKTPGEGSSAPSSSSSSSSSSASSSSFQSSALPRENNNALSKKNPILFFLS